MDGDNPEHDEIHDQEPQLDHEYMRREAQSPAGQQDEIEGMPIKCILIRR